MKRLGGQAGYTMPELLIASAVMGLLVTAIASIYSTTLAQVTSASSLEDAQSSLRLGLDRMAADLRLAGSYYANVPGADTAIIAASATSVTFMGDIDADSVTGTTETTLTTATAGTHLTLTGVAAAFNTYGTASTNDWLHIANGGTREARRVASVSGSVVTITPGLSNSFPVGSLVRAVERVTYTFNATPRTLTRQLGDGTADVLADNVTGMTLTYYNNAGTSLGSTPGTLSNIFEIEVTLTTAGSDGSRRSMATRVRLRNS